MCEGRCRADRERRGDVAPLAEQDTAHVADVERAAGGLRGAARRIDGASKIQAVVQSRAGEIGCCERQTAASAPDLLRGEARSAQAVGLRHLDRGARPGDVEHRTFERDDDPRRRQGNRPAGQSAAGRIGGDARIGHEGAGDVEHRICTDPDVLRRTVDGDGAARRLDAAEHDGGIARREADVGERVADDARALIDQQRRGGTCITRGTPRVAALHQRQVDRVAHAVERKAAGGEIAQPRAGHRETGLRGHDVSLLFERHIGAGGHSDAAVGRGQLEVSKPAVGEQRGRQHHRAGSRARGDGSNPCRLLVDDDGRHLQAEASTLRQPTCVDRSVHDDIGAGRRFRRVGEGLEPGQAERFGGDACARTPCPGVAQQREVAALALGETIRAERKPAVDADIAAARHVDHAALRQDERGAAIHGRHDLRGGIVGDHLAQIVGAQADATTIDEKRASEGTAITAGVVDPLPADVQQGVGADGQRRQRAGSRRHYTGCRCPADGDAAAMRGERAVDIGGAAKLDAAAVAHRQAGARGHGKRVGAADRERAEAEGREAVGGIGDHRHPIGVVRQRQRRADLEP